SLIIVAASDDFTVRKDSGGKRSARANRSKRSRRNMRSPSAPLATLIQYLKAPLTSTRNRNRPDRPIKRPIWSTLKPPKIGTFCPPRKLGTVSEISKSGALVLPPLKAPPWIASLTMRLGRSSDQK